MQWKASDFFFSCFKKQMCFKMQLRLGEGLSLLIVVCSCLKTSFCRHSRNGAI